MSSDGRVAYVVSRFPKTTETFIVREMLAVERRGWHVTVLAIRREHREIVQPGAERFLDRLTAISDLGAGRLVGAQLRLARRRPGRWWSTWWRAVVGNARSPRFLVRAVVVAAGAPALAERVRADGVEHLHAHWGTHAALLAHLVAHITGLPYTVTLHAHDLHVDRTMLATKLRDAAHVVTVSEHNAEIVRREYPAVADRTTVVHCGVDVGALRRRDGPGAPDRIVTVAGLRAFKGHRHLLDALGILGRRGVDVSCDLVGDGPLRDDLVRAAPSNVRFHGALDVDRALAIAREATVFVMPSVELADGRRDGIPVALVEAMAIGVPVVASAVSGIPELVHDGRTGVLVPPGDPTALADAIEGLVGDVERRRRLAEYARDLVEQEFDIETTGERMTSIFDRARRTRRGGGPA